MTQNRTASGRDETDPLDIPWSELATPAGAPAPNEKRRQRERAAAAACRAETHRTVGTRFDGARRVTMPGVALAHGVSGMADRARRRISAEAHGRARATERHREDLLLEAVANVVGREEAAHLTTLAMREPYPGERPEDSETPRQRELRGVEERLDMMPLIEE